MSAPPSGLEWLLQLDWQAAWVRPWALQLDSAPESACEMAQSSVPELR